MLLSTKFWEKATNTVGSGKADEWQQKERKHKYSSFLFKEEKMKIIHRGDQMLQRSVGGELKNSPGENVISLRKAMLEFVESKLINVEKEIENREALQKILESWPGFARQRVVNKECVIYAMHEKEGIIICNDGVFDYLTVGIIKF